MLHQDCKRRRLDQKQGAVFDAFNGDIWYIRAEQLDAKKDSAEDEGQGLSRDQAVNVDRGLPAQHAAVWSLRDSSTVFSVECCRDLRGGQAIKLPQENR